jgi:plasmid stabilization system protein ParE
MDFRAVINANGSRGSARNRWIYPRENREVARQLATRSLTRRSLAKFPDQGRIVSELAGEETKEINLRWYRIIYYVDKAHQAVYVVRFWHSARSAPIL